MLTNDLIVQENDPIINAMKSIDSGLYKIAIAVDNNQKVVGTITDGDIRRGLLDGNSLQSPIRAIMNKDFKYIRAHEDIKKAKETLNKSQSPVRHLPVIDDFGKLQDLLVGNVNLMRNKNNSVLIMAGGQGKRLRPYTNQCPKPMIKVNEIPILEIILKNCIDEGFVDFYFSVFYLKNSIIKYFGDGSKWGVSIKYLEEQEPLGTAGALSLIRETLINPLLVLNGDILTKVNLTALLDFHNLCNSKTTICSRNYSIDIPFGVVKSKGTKFISLDEKPTENFQVNAGIYIFDPDVLNLVQENIYLDMPNFIEIIDKNNHKISVFPIHEFWIDIGRKESLEKAKLNWPAD